MGASLGDALFPFVLMKGKPITKNTNCATGGPISLCRNLNMQTIN